MKEIVKEINEIIKRHDDNYFNNNINNKYNFERLVYLIKKLNL